LNLQIICTFNTDLTNVDEALLRKGRLIAKYEFKALAEQKSQALSNDLGFSTYIHTCPKRFDSLNIAPDGQLVTI
jgi:hypothetical protein